VLFVTGLFGSVAYSIVIGGGGCDGADEISFYGRDCGVLDGGGGEFGVGDCGSACDGGGYGDSDCGVGGGECGVGDCGSACDAGECSVGDCVSGCDGGGGGCEREE